MPLTTAQCDWIRQFSNVNTGDWEKREQLRNDLLKNVRSQVAVVKAEVRELVSITLNKKGGKQLQLLIGDGKERWAADEELDTTHDTRDLAEAISRDDMRRAMQAKDTLNSLSQQLESAVCNGMPLFTAKEIREEYWQPLMREGICPDNLIDDLYNETVQVFQGANKYYEARQEAEAELHQNSNLADGKFLMDKAATIASSIADACGAPPLAGTIIESTNTFAQASMTIIEGVIEKDAKTVFDSVGNVLGQSLKVAGFDATLAGLIGGAFSSASSGGLACEALIKGDPKAAFGHIAICIESSFALADTGNANGPYTEIGHYIALSMQSCVDIKSAADCLRKNPVDIKGLMAIAESATQRAFSEGMGAYTSKLKEAGKITEEQKSSLDGGGGKALANAFEAANLRGEVSPEAKQALAKQHDKAIQEELARELDPNNRDFENELDGLLAQASMSPDERKTLGTETEFQNSIEKMILKIERTRAALKIAEGIFDTGMKTAAEFFEPLKMAAAGKDFVKNMIIAAKRAIELNQWIDQVEKALNAASVYAAAFANRIKNLKIQITERTVHALFDLMKVVGGAITAAGAMAAPAGLIIGKAASAGQALADIASMVRERVDAALQWKKYIECLQLARQGLTDRKMMRQVLRDNPTLSKYAMAYGAVIEGDPIAKMGMKVCGITEANLQEEGTSVELVVKYLETKLNDDPKLLKAQAENGWKPEGDGEVSLIIWKQNLRSLTDQTGFLQTNLGAIEGAFAEFEATRDTYDELAPLYEDAFTAFESEMKSVVLACAPFETAAAEYEKLSREYGLHVTAFEKVHSQAESDPSKKQDVSFRQEYVNAMQSVLGLFQSQERAAKRMSDSLPEYRGKVTYFGRDKAAPFIERAEPLSMARTNYLTAISRLSKAIAKYKPMLQPREAEAKAPNLQALGYFKDVVLALSAIDQQIRGSHSDIESQLRLAIEYRDQHAQKTEAARQRAVDIGTELKKGIAFGKEQLEALIAEWDLTDSEKEKQLLAQKKVTQQQLQGRYRELGGDGKLLELALKEWDKNEQKRFNELVERQQDALSRLNVAQSDVQRAQGTKQEAETVIRAEQLQREVDFRTREVQLADERKLAPSTLDAWELHKKVQELTRLAGVLPSL